ncbi:MAG: hypothetical protein JWQ81_5520 [Amycolatopsis sp.]|jgi:hypothetical protein|uniref:hypothetical protein n=1 Tax=Amycolatopsis sp. TaxID=37632 RepID=UPI00262CD8C9|nr:hypothetical protein [Amycolatopsis sp.]MCU1684781.1 hypothetical protein [Amycolatopsis sp.]
MAVRVTHAPEPDEAEVESLGRALRRRFGFSLLGSRGDLPEKMPSQRSVGLRGTRRPYVVARSARPIEEHLQLSLLSRGYPAMPRL